MTAEEFVTDRIAELGNFIGPIIGGIYEGIRKGVYDRRGDYAAVTGRLNQSWDDYFASLHA